MEEYIKNSYTNKTQLNKHKETGGGDSDVSTEKFP